uniref:L-glutamate gamma-semialdehyde dehydrogenase n=1 Tax=Fervidicoccus fontis TaxID=683846 RepID=A0A7J3ZKI6_9CREN
MKWRLEKPKNEKILTYAQGTKERELLKKKLEELSKKTVEIPLVIGSRLVKTEKKREIRASHDHKKVLAIANLAGEQELLEAIDKALDAWQKWSELEWYHRVAVFLRAAELLAGPYRIEAIASIMLNQSKTPYEAEIDLAELVDFWRFNSYYVQFLYENQPDQHPGEVNRLDWRPLEGFIAAIPPFNFFSIAGNLPTAPAIVGNVAIWKPASDVIYSNYIIMRVLQEAGLPPGVVNFVPSDHKSFEVVFKHPDFAGLHFTGSYETFVMLWKKIAENLESYRNFPRIVGETGGKDFIVVHSSADVRASVVATIRGAFEYQGQKCSAASRLFVARSVWENGFREMLLQEVSKVRYGPIEDFSVFGGAVINKSAFDKIVSYIEYAKSHPEEYTILHGGGYDDSKGWFIEPTIILTNNPRGKLMREEIFGPVLTVYVYEDSEYSKILDVVDAAAPYGLTGSIMARDRYAILEAERKLRYAAGNFYINDKPTGAIVGRQPFGGTRWSGTNDKAGYWLNLLKWLNPRAIKENLNPPLDWRREYML